jgi:hypothetical protein
MQATQLALPDIDASLSLVGGLTAEAAIGAEFCKLVTSVYSLYTETITLSLDAASRLLIMLGADQIATAQALEDIQLTQCARLQQQLQTSLAGAYQTDAAMRSGDANGISSGAGSSSSTKQGISSVAQAFANDGYINVATYSSFGAAAGMVYSLAPKRPPPPMQDISDRKLRQQGFDAAAAAPQWHWRLRDTPVVRSDDDGNAIAARLASVQPAAARQLLDANSASSPVEVCFRQTVMYRQSARQVAYKCFTHGTDCGTACTSSNLCQTFCLQQLVLI